MYCSYLLKVWKPILLVHGCPAPARLLRMVPPLPSPLTLPLNSSSAGLLGNNPAFMFLHLPRYARQGLAAYPVPIIQIRCGERGVSSQLCSLRFTNQLYVFHFAFPLCWVKRSSFNHREKVQTEEWFLTWNNYFYPESDSHSYISLPKLHFFFLSQDFLEPLFSYW